MLGRCSHKICSTITHVKLAVQKGEATRVIYLHALLWLITLWLDAENYTIDAKIWICFRLIFPSLAYE